MLSETRPFRLGVTGGIASGKSTVMTILGDLGAETIDADQVYHELIEPGRPLNAALVGRWGDRIRRPDGRIDRRALGTIVFADPAELAALDHLTHPAIRQKIDTIVASSQARVVAVDAVKLIESGRADSCDSVWLVLASPAIQVERLIASRQLDRADAERRVASQSDWASKISRADVVIRNDSTPENLDLSVRDAWRRLPIHHQ